MGPVETVQIDPALPPIGAWTHSRNQ
jgi:hypothetical protein